ncbi:MAG: hypothetical protein N3B01_07765, partial [Verrucomicrobiae bacterium]|nr:hypothetical protein [Verrucomicrobiae bacterium]
MTHLQFTHEIKKPTPRHRAGERGVALILTLAILVLVTMLVVAFAITMRVEHDVARNYSDHVRARHLAMAAVDEAVARLRLATPVINAMTNYVTMPGRILIRSYVSGNVTYTNIPLYSVGTTNVYAGLNLGGRRLINRFTSSQIGVEWCNWVMPNTPRAGYNRLYGRYAYWIDDEASKININVAYRAPDAPVERTYTPQDLDLRVLSTSTAGGFGDQAIAQASYNYGQTVGYLSPNSWRACSSQLNPYLALSN